MRIDAYRSLLLILIPLFITRCGVPSIDSLYGEGEFRNRFLRDEYGRALILRGVNLSNHSKWSPYLPQQDEEDFDKMKGWGFNVVRYLILWIAIEPEPGVYDETYLDEVEERLDMLAERGINVILDMHQDLYSEKYSGDGAPFWACIDGGVEFEPYDMWYLNYMTEAVINAFDSFWDDVDGIQTHIINAWCHVVERFKDHPAVIGYDLFNEPFFGSHDMEEFDEDYLTPFYKTLIGEMQKIDPDSFYFFEPNIMKGSGLVSHLERLDLPNLVYAPHYYDPTVVWVLPYDGDPSRMEEAFSLIDEESKEFDTCWFLGEFGIVLENEGAEKYMIDQMNLIDKYMVGFTYWDWSQEDSGMGIETSDGEEKWVLDVLVQPYPMATAGTPLSFSFDEETGVFRLSYIENRDVKMPTELFIPERHFPDLFEVTFTKGERNYTFDQERRVLYIETGDGGVVELYIRRWG